MATKRKKRKRRSGGSGRGSGGGGLMMGMRSGFKKAANATLGTGEAQQAKGKKAWIGTVVTIALLIAAVALLMKRF